MLCSFAWKFEFMPPKILVIDDDAGLRTAIASTLARLGYDVRAADDGRSGLALFDEAPADLVITDIFMPDVEGVAVIVALKLRADPPKILAISGGGGFDVLGLARAVGADAVAAKPLSMSNLVRRVEDLLAAPGRAAA